MNTIEFNHNNHTLKAEYKTGNRHSYLNVWLGGKQISENEFCCHCPEYETDEGLKQAAIESVEMFEAFKGLQIITNDE